MRIKKINKKAAIGEGVFTIYRLILVTFIAFIILGVAAVFYEYYIDVRDVEARIVAKNVINCVISNNLGSFPDKMKTNLFDYCGIKNTDRLYASVLIKDENGKEITFLSQGKEGAKWFLDIIEKDKAKGSLKKYKPGYFQDIYYFDVTKDNLKIKYNLNVEVFVNPENVK